jgi:DNA polymerase-3 subunit alpha
VNKKTLESLVKAGAMDKYGNRASLLIAIPEVVQKANEAKKQALEGQSSLFGDIADTQETISVTHYDIDDFTTEEKLGFEKELLGFYLTSHPHMATLSHVRTLISHDIPSLQEEEEGTIVKIGGIIDNAKKIFTKKTNAEMAFLQVIDENGVSIECVVFPRVFEQYKGQLVQDTVVLIDGKLNLKDDRPVIIVDRVVPTNHIVL